MSELQFTDEDNKAVEWCETNHPELTAEYKKIMMNQYITFCKKHRNYGCGNINVGTNLETEGDVRLALTGLWFRMNDKIQRLKTLLMGKKENAVEGEPMEDAYLDVSNYGIMATIVKKGKWGK